MTDQDKERKVAVSRKRAKPDKLKWSFEGLATLGNTIVGNVELAPNGDWRAYGMLEEWQDEPLGSFKTYFQARRAVTRWVWETV